MISTWEKAERAQSTRKDAGKPGLAKAVRRFLNRPKPGLNDPERAAALRRMISLGTPGSPTQPNEKPEPSLREDASCQ